MAYAREGDVKSLSALVIANAKWLKAYLRGMVRFDEEAEDAFQECWVRVIRSCRSYRGGSVRAYLARVARSVVIDRHRRRDPEAVSIDAEVEPGVVVGDCIAADGDAPGEAMDDEMRRVQLRRAIRALSSEQREVLLLRVEGELTFKEIAEQLSVPLGTALTWMRSATLALRKAIGGAL